MRIIPSPGAVLVTTSFCVGAGESWWWPPSECVSFPDDPSCVDDVTVRLGGQWPDTCIPTGSFARVEGDTIVFEVHVDYPKGTGCLFVIVPWLQVQDVGVLSAGNYTVVAELYEDDVLERGPDEVCDVVVDAGPADIDRSGVVDVADLVDLLAAWGPCSGCPEDVTGDDVVDAEDLVALLDAWGSC
jgi:hypothetical protein